MYFEKKRWLVKAAGRAYLNAGWLPVRGDLHKEIRDYVETELKRRGLMGERSNRTKRANG